MSWPGRPAAPRGERPRSDWRAAPVLAVQGGCGTGDRREAPPAAVGRVLPLAQAPEAQELNRTGAAESKIVVAVKV